MIRNKRLRIVLLVLGVLIIIYMLGPHPSKPVYSNVLPAVPATPLLLEKFIAANEARHKLKPNNQARIVWFDSAKIKTQYSIVYLHGFSASQEEGRPIHINIAKEFGCNLYLSRLAEHGIDTAEPMINLTPDKLWESAKQALQIGKQLGNKVILMATSTGGTLALKLAAEYPNDIYGLVLMSPNIAIDNSAAFLLNNPWGLKIARAVVGSHYVISKDARPIYKQYWYWHYPLEATVQLQELIATTMTSQIFEKVKQPTLVLYYYKDDVHRDSVVSIPAIQTMFKELGTPANKKAKVVMPYVGDHVMGSYIKSKDLLDVQQSIQKFMMHDLKMKMQ